MADEDIEDKEEAVDELKTKLAKDQAKDLNKVTDVVEEKELDSRKAQQVRCM